MKKIFLTISLVAAFTFGAFPLQAASGEPREFDITEALALYLPNRILDALDLFTVNLGVGPVLEARLMATRAVDVGGGIGMSYKAYKTHHRQYGLGQEQGWYWSMICVGEEDFGVVDGTPLIDKYSELRTGVPSPTMRVYDFYDGARDYWQIGGTLGGLVTGDLYTHPLEWLDLAAGVFLLDPSGDDLRFDDFR